MLKGAGPFQNFFYCEPIFFFFYWIYSMLYEVDLLNLWVCHVYTQMQQPSKSKNVFMFEYTVRNHILTIPTIFVIQYFICIQS